MDGINIKNIATLQLYSDPQITTGVTPKDGQKLATRAGIASILKT